MGLTPSETKRVELGESKPKAVPKSSFMASVSKLFHQQRPDNEKREEAGESNTLLDEADGGGVIPDLELYAMGSDGLPGERISFGGLPSSYGLDGIKLEAPPPPRVQKATQSTEPPPSKVEALYRKIEMNKRDV